MTHILIPIEDIKKDLDFYKSCIQNKPEYYSGCADVLDKILLNSKQISLSEEDIEAKSERVAMDSYKLDLTPIETYRQVIH